MREDIAYRLVHDCGYHRLLVRIMRYYGHNERHYTAVLAVVDEVASELFKEAYSSVQSRDINTQDLSDKSGKDMSVIGVRLPGSASITSGQRDHRSEKSGFVCASNV